MREPSGWSGWGAVAEGPHSLGGAIEKPFGFPAWGGVITVLWKLQPPPWW